MYLKIVTREGTETTHFDNERIKELSFTPEYDPTLNSYPACTLEAMVFDAVHSESYFVGYYVLLYGLQPSSSEDYSSLVAGYYKITEVKRNSDKLLYIKANSIFSELDKKQLTAHFYNYEYIEDCIDDIFNQAAAYGSLYYIWPAVRGHQVYGYCPEQTARERLTWILQSLGDTVLQWGEYSRYGLCIARAIDAESDTNYGLHTAELLPYENTYRKPEIENRNAVSKFSFTRYYQWSDDQPGAEGWESIITGYDYTFDVEGNVYDRYPIYKYYFTQTTVATNPSATVGNEISLSGNMLVWSTMYMTHLMRAYFRDKTFKLDMLITDRNFQKYMPNTKVKFYADQTTMYTGVIRSAQFIPGQFTRVKLVIDTDSTPVSLVHVRFNYAYVEGQTNYALGHRDYYVVPGNYMTVNHPTFKSYVVDRWETFTPQTASTTIQPSQDTTTTINYSRS